MASVEIKTTLNADTKCIDVEINYGGLCMDAFSVSMQDLADLGVTAEQYVSELKAAIGISVRRELDRAKQYGGAEYIQRGAPKEVDD